MKKKPSELFEEHNPNCVQCGEETAYFATGDYDKYLRVGMYVCNNEKCPNYGLLQVGIERMPIEE